MFFAAKTIKEADIRKALGAIKHPRAGATLESLGMIGGIIIKPDGNLADVKFVITLKEEDQSSLDALRALTEKCVSGLKGVKEAHGIFTMAAPEKHAPSAAHGKTKTDLSHLGKIIAVLSGKGGVGKSTVAANLACALAQKGLRVGLLDADVYGPSVPRLFALTEKPKTENNKLVPLEKYGLKIMSIGFMVEEGTPVIWRGAMVQTALKQMLHDVAWGQLDALVIDMPPGTGDAQLTLAQNVPMAGGVIVSTPQDLALIDARKAIAMLKRVEVPILGVIENMSQFICPHCGTASDIFGHGGAAKEAEKIGAEFLGEIPLTIRLRETSDTGTPITAIASDDKLSEHFRACADRVWVMLETRNRPVPRISVED